MFSSFTTTPNAIRNDRAGAIVCPPVPYTHVKYTHFRANSKYLSGLAGDVCAVRAMLVRVSVHSMHAFDVHEVNDDGPVSVLVLVGGPGSYANKRNTRVVFGWSATSLTRSAGITGYNGPLVADLIIMLACS